MNEWIKKNRDAILIAGVSTIATAIVVGVSVKVTKTVMDIEYAQTTRLMSLIASDAGVLDKIIEHQNKLSSLNQ